MSLISHSPPASLCRKHLGWEISSSNWQHFCKVSLEEKADALFLIVALNHFFFFFSLQTQGLCGYKFQQLVSIPPATGEIVSIYHCVASVTAPLDLLKSTGDVLLCSVTTTQQQPPQKTPSLFIHSPRILLHSASTNKNTLSVYSGHKITSWNINTKQLGFFAWQATWYFYYSSLHSSCTTVK